MYGCVCVCQSHGETDDFYCQKYFKNKGANINHCFLYFFPSHVLNHNLVCTYF